MLTIRELKMTLGGRTLFENASFDRADLTKVDARGSNLYEAGFWEAVTKDANWRGANLTNTLLG